MKSPFSIHNLNPGLVNEVEDAYQRNVEAGRVVSDEFTGDVAKKSLKDLLQRETEEIEKSSIESFATIEDKDTKEDFEIAFQDTELLFSRATLETPSPAEFKEAGVDFADLARKYIEMVRSNLDPQIVIAPVHGDYEVWEGLFKGLADDSSIPANPLRQGKDRGLYIAEDIKKAWWHLDTAPKDDTPVVYIEDGQWPDGVQWTIRLIPEGADSVRSKHWKSKHPTIAEYLTLQANIIKKGQYPVDYQTPTWLDGVYNGSSGSGIQRYAIGMYGSNEVKIDYVTDPTGVSTHIGVRPPVS